MIDLTNEARELLNRYLGRAKLSLRGTSVEAEEVEKDIRAHVDEALADHESPVAAADLAEILDRLGSPTQWVPDDEIPFWRRAVANLAEGGEDWRLAYLCFGMTILGMVTLLFGGIVLLVGAVFLSRAAIALAEERDEPLGAKKWLVYPPLVFFGVMLIIIPVVMPVAGIAALATESWEGGVIDLQVLGVGGSVSRLVALSVAMAGMWWVILGAIAALAARPIRWALVPLANGFRPVHASWLAVVGALLVLGSGAALILL